MGTTDKPQAIAFGFAGLAEAIVQTADQPLLVLRADLTVEDVNSAFCELFKIGAEETRGCLLYELGDGQWNIPELRRLLDEILPQRSIVKGFRVEHKFPEIGRRVMLLNARRIPADDDRPELILLFISDRTQAEQARFELEGHREFQEKLIDSVREALLVLDWELKFVRANQAFYEIFKVSPSESEGRMIYELGNRQWDIPRLRELLENVLPDNNAFDDVEIEHDFEHIGRRIMLLNGRRLDHLNFILLAIRDVTEQRRTEALQKMLMGELDHRVRNVLATVSALASQTVRDSHSLKEFGEAFQKRVAALARTQEILLREPQSHVSMAEIVRLELRAQGGDEGRNFDLEGPEIALPPDAIQAFAMAVHELSTNAVKHGALATAEGRVEISWKLHPGEGGTTGVQFRWREHCPRIHTTPARKGYGSRLLKGTFRNSLSGTSRFTLHSDGAEFEADFQLH